MTNDDLWHMVSISGGKDSTATALLARERGIEAQLVFADTEHEHPQTYDYLEYLDKTLGPIRTVKADFSRDMARKRAWIEAHWFDDLTAGREGKWQWIGLPEDKPEERPPVPANPYASTKVGCWKWVCALHPWSAEKARAHVAEALAVLQPTGNAFLDLCLWKGRFPSTRRRFCSEELKHKPLRDQVVEPMQADGWTVVSWQGVRAAESRNRALLDIVDQPEEQLIQYRPIIAWSADEVFAMHRKHGVEWNPLYEQDMGRVGCMPCIHVNKAELRQIARRWPEVIDRLEQWEALAQKASKHGIATFGDVRKFVGNADVDYDVDIIDIKQHGIRAYVKWAQSARGGRQGRLDLDDPVTMCSSIYGLCESAR
jgi:3'-phosphoadenosine 5'-phosphosulfate sulfotransferase (PAPS reductase)/FAD synthetase